jgi:alanine dehydrogenase
MIFSLLTKTTTRFGCMKIKTLIYFLVFFSLSVGTALAAGGTYTPLVGIPGVDPGANIGAYLNALYKLSIGIAAILATVKIIIAGIKYMMSEVVNTKGDAINDIKGSLFGLIIVVSSVLILGEINPQLVNTTLLISEVDPSASRDIRPPATPPTETGNVVERAAR